MKRIKKILLSLSLVSMFFSLFGSSVSAEDGTPYAYTITLSAGNKGTIDGASKVVLTSELAAGRSMMVDVEGMVNVTDDKYYVKGIRLSGRDNAETLDSPVIQGDGDQDYVVAYGMKGNMVAYTVNYQDAAGNDLAPRSTLYGNPGDKPVVAYRYIANYVPQALAMTKTLSENEAENVFNFVYTPGEAGTVTETTTPTVTIIDNTVPPAGTADGAPGATAPGANADGGTAPDAQAGAEGEGQTIPDEETPQDLVDLDDEETPTSDMKIKDDSTAKKAPMLIAAAVAVAAVTGLAALLIVLKKGKKNRLK